ncbi:MAG: dTMP kinase [Acidimicrobiales bacterium]
MTPSERGRLIAVEGIDGCGKSTQARLLADSLGALLTFEPGATLLGSGVRRLALDPILPEPVPRAEALLMAADRAQHVDEVILPALDCGRWVVTDRFSGSTLAYQGAGRGLDTDALGRLVDWAANGLVPDLSVLVDVTVATARLRLAAGAPDRLEGLDDGFHERVRRGFLSIAHDAGPSWVVIDGSGSAPQVGAEIVRAVERRLGRPDPRPPARNGHGV